MSDHRSYRVLIPIALATVAASPGTKPTPKPFGDVLACRTVTDPTARLDCYDKTVSALSTASEQRSIAVVDRAQVDEARRSLFGFTLPKLSILGVGDKNDAGPREITSTIRSARQNADGQWVIVLVDGAVWHQIDQNQVFRDPHAGSTVVIQRALMGSYFIKVDGQIGFRAVRQS